MGALAIVTNTQLLLIVLGGLFVIETASVIAQVIAFRGFSDGSSGCRRSITTSSSRVGPSSR